MLPNRLEQTEVKEAPKVQQQVFDDPNLLYCIARFLKPRGRLLLSTLTHACARAVDLPELWSTISWTIVWGNGPGCKTPWSYSEAAKFGNRLGCVLRRYGRHCARLHLASCPWLQVTGLEDLARCSNLVHIDMSGCSMYSVDLLGHLVRHCPNLRSLLARGCPRICKPAIIQELFDTPKQHRLNLEHLDLQGVMFSQDTSDLGAALGRAVERLAADRLVTLRLGWTGEAGRDPLYQGDLSVVLQLVARCGATLRLLDLPGCCGPPPTEQSLAAALGCLSQLRALCLSNWQGGGEVGAALRRCTTTQLLHLNLRAVLPLVDGDLVPLLRANPGLRSLNVGCCPRLTDTSLELVAAACRDLESLDVCYATGMSAGGVRLVATSLPRLTQLGFSGFAGLGDTDVADMLTRLPGLRMLGLGGVPRLTDTALRAIAASCPSLETLYAADLPNVTHCGLAALLQGCPRLRRVHMSQCAQLTASDRELLYTSYGYEFDGDMLPSDVVREENEFAGGG